ncbi:MFS transporter [Nocardia donostiensis]|uniref:Putative proline/betaine transporter n=1 Tax=Nocardia donostiensis TaxID=1538463 RepID=A0A1V2TG18_9NOCA|nr:MFS transporter [Nocardia donostiensis]ONM48424.1 MFS transporter [Nocardia donostiensis]OQS16188.1 MFS transporter [Nocardia donostiensis]OQS17834.1 MFS transporter [Nocardia donostiensis]
MSTSPLQDTDPTVIDKATAPDRLIRRAAFSSLLGTTIEYYDFILYGTMAAIVFGQLFFPASNPALSTIASFGTLAAGYVARPLGGVIFGHFGDRLGRKSMLMITMMMMGTSSAVIGLLPTYHTIGVLAPILLVVLRIVQGIAVGGEWGGAALIVVEHATADRRGRWAGIMQLGTPFGFLLSTAAVAVVTQLPEPTFTSWGWRVPFLLSAALLVLGMYVRLRVVESPVFVAAESHRQHSPTTTPVLQVFRRPRQVVLAVAAGIAPFALTALISSHIIAYATGIGYDVSDVMRSLLAVVLVSIVAIPLCAALSDRFGRRRVMMAGAIGAVLYAFPLYAMINTHSLWLMTAALMAAQLLQNAMYAPLTPLLSEIFPTRVRYTGVSVAYQSAALIGAGFTPLIASSLLAAFGGSSVPLSVIVAGTAVLTLAALVITAETNGRDLHREPEFADRA